MSFYYECSIFPPSNICFNILYCAPMPSNNYEKVPCSITSDSMLIKLDDRILSKQDFILYVFLH